MFAGIAQFYWPSPWDLLLWNDFVQRIRTGFLALILCCASSTSGRPLMSLNRGILGNG